MRIGTRASALALAQARWVAERLGPDSELVPVTTAGDRSESPGDKSRWVSELERALLEERIDVAVHSAKDVPAELAAGLELVAIPARADPCDAICGAASLRALAPGARIGTSSLRRAAQIRAVRDDLEVVEVRGNVDTRLRKLDAGEVDALVLAAAGLARLGLEDRIGGRLEDLVPAAGQGALALEAIPGRLAPEVLAGVRDPEAAACVEAERELTRALGASCDTPVGAHARPLGGDRFELRAWVGTPDGAAWLSDRVESDAAGLRAGSGAEGVRAESRAAGLGALVAARMLAAGAGELLRAAERSVRA